MATHSSILAWRISWMEEPGMLQSMGSHRVRYNLATESKSSHLILCCPLLLLPSIFPSIRVFSNESALCMGWPKYWSFSFSISPSNEYSGLISFRIDWFILLVVQATLKSLQHQFESINSSALRLLYDPTSHICT